MSAPLDYQPMCGAARRARRCVCSKQAKSTQDKDYNFERNPRKIHKELEAVFSCLLPLEAKEGSALAQHSHTVF